MNVGDPDSFFKEGSIDEPSVTARDSRWLSGSQIGHSTLSAGKPYTWGRPVGKTNLGEET